MRKYEVHLTNRIVNIEAGTMGLDWTRDLVTFYKDDESIATFVLSNICGVRNVEEFE